jgi:hypothetical protein
LARPVSSAGTPTPLDRFSERWHREAAPAPTRNDWEHGARTVLLVMAYVLWFRLVAMFIGQQFMQNVLGYSTVDVGLAILPAAIPHGTDRTPIGQAGRGRGARFTLLTGYLFVLLGFLTMLLLWRENIPYWKVGLGYALIGTGVGFAGTPSSHSFTGSVSVTRAGMASGTADLERDRRNHAIHLRALLTAGYARAATATIAATPASARYVMSCIIHREHGAVLLRQTRTPSGSCRTSRGSARRCALRVARSGRVLSARVSTAARTGGRGCRGSTGAVMRGRLPAHSAAVLSAAYCEPCRTPSLTMIPAFAHGTNPGTIWSWFGGGYVIVPVMDVIRTVMLPSRPRSRCRNQNLSLTMEPSPATGAAGQGPSQDERLPKVDSRPSAMTVSAAAARAIRRPGRRNAIHSRRRSSVVDMPLVLQIGT